MISRLKRLIRPFYLKMVKSKFGRKIRNSLKPELKAYIVNDNIIIESVSEEIASWSLAYDKDRWKSENKKVKLSLNNGVINLIRNKNFKVLVDGYSTTATFEGDEFDFDIDGHFVELNQKQYCAADAKYALVHFDVINDTLNIDLDIHGTENKDFLKESRLVLVDNDYDTVVSLAVSDKPLQIDHINEVLEENHELQILLVEKDCFIPVVTMYTSDEKLAVREDLSRLYITQPDTSYVFQPDKLKVKTQDLKPQYKYIDKISYEARENKILINLKENYTKCQKFVLYIKNLKTNEREKVAVIPTGVQVEIENVSELLNREINLIDRFVLEFEIYSTKGNKLETNWLRLIQPKTRAVKDYILSEAYGNVLTFFDRQILLICNKENHYIYSEKYDFDLAANTFTSDCEVTEQDGKIKLEFKIYSLLSKIQKYTVYLTDNYAKYNFVLYEKIMDEANRTVEGCFDIDIEQLHRNMYYNARLNFRLGIEYVGGFKETGFLVKKYAEYSTKERYLYTHEMPEDMVMSFYLGMNQYNLNAWFTSRDEYEKGIKFQTGREKYFDTLKNEKADDKLIFFEANLGKNYTGNPKYLYEYMIRNPKYSDYKFVWAYPDTNSSKIPGNPILVERGTSEYFYYLAKAKYWVNNILFPVKKKREETVYLQTWHGTPLKKLGFDIECEGPEKQAFGNLYQESQNWDYFLADNDYGAEKLVHAFRFKKRLIKEGYPINDIFYKEELKNKAKERLLSQYPAIKNKKVIVYAPTWRDLQGDYVRGYDFSLPFDVDRLYTKFSDEYVLLVKLHHLIADSLEIDDKYKNFLLNVSGEEDVMELLCIADILITDYSSVFYDFASARKPMLFYAYDLEEYVNETRGLYVGMNTLPGPILQDNDSLVDAIENIEQYDYAHSEKLRAFCDDMAKYCDGHSCEKVLDIVLSEEKDD